MDIKTLSFILTITHIFQSIAMIIQYKIQKTNPVGWWVAGFTLTALGSICIFFQQIRALLYLLIILNNLFLIAGLICDYIGILRFLGKKEKTNFLIIFYILFTLFITYFTFIKDSIILRMVVFSFSVVIISSLASYVLIKYKKSEIKASLNFIAIVFLILFLFFLFRAIFLLHSEMSIKSAFDPLTIQALTFIVTIIAGIMLCVGFIISLNQRLTNELIETKNYLMTLYNTSPDAILLTRVNNGLIIDANESFVELTGYNKEEIIGKTTFDLNIWVNPYERETLINKIKEKGFCNNFESLFMKKNGQIISGLVSAKIIQINNEFYLISVARDITEIKKLEKERQIQFNFIKTVINSINYPIFVINTENYKVEMTNKTAGYYENKNILQCYDIQNFLCKTCNKEKGFCPIDIVKNEKKSFIFENTIKDNEGRERFFEIHFDPIFDENGNVPQLIEYHIDITLRKEVENKLKEINEIKNKFFMIISHDLKAPFASSLSLLNLLSEEISHSKNRDNNIDEIIKILSDNFSRTYDLTQNIFSWAESQSGKIKINPTPINLKEVIKDTFNTLQNISDQKSIKLQIDIKDDEEFTAFADLNTLKTILRNLINNAIKFTPKNGDIHMGAIDNNENIIIYIKDTGAGIDEDKIQLLFAMGENYSTIGTEGEKGSGFGLKLCKELVELNHGKIWVESKKNVGTTFYFTLPRFTHS